MATGSHKPGARVALYGPAGPAGPPGVAGPSGTGGSGGSILTTGDPVNPEVIFVNGDVIMVEP